MSTLPRILEAVHRSLASVAPVRVDLSSAKAASTNARRSLLVGSCVGRERDVELCSATYFAPLNLFPNFGAKLDRVPLGSASDVLFF